MATNKYGLDVHYMRKKLQGIIAELDNYTPDEAFNDLSRMALVAASQAGHKVTIDVKFAKEPTNDN